LSSCLTHHSNRGTLGGAAACNHGIPNLTLACHGRWDTATITVDGGAGFGTKTFIVVFTVNKTNQGALTINDPGTKTTADAPFQLSTTGGSGSVTSD